MSGVERCQNEACAEMTSNRASRVVVARFGIGGKCVSETTVKVVLCDKCKREVGV